jgi:hypothetical protein
MRGRLCLTAACPSVQRGASQLVDAAVDPKNLCRLDPTYMSWL